jgi:hypothetical protein
MSRPRKAPGTIGKLGSGLTGLLIAGLIGIVSLGLLMAGFGELRELRQLERTPRSLIASILPGEVNVSGTAQPSSGVLRAPDSGAATLYYRFHVEREVTDSEGDKSWTTVSDEQEWIGFVLADESGEIRVEPSGRVEFQAARRHQRRDGDMRYTEYRIDPNDQAFVFGHVADADRPQVGFDADGHYRPIISTYGEASARSGMAQLTLFLLWLGLGALGFAVYKVLWALRVHLSYIYLGALSLSVALVMLLLATSTARDDLQASFDRSVRDIAAAERQVERRYREAGLQWDGDWSHVGESEWEATRLGAEQQRLLHHLRERIGLQIDRTLAIRTQFPEWLVARSMDLPLLPDISLPSDVDIETQRRARATDSGPVLSTIVGLVMLGLAGLFGVLGFRRIRLKRTIENLPTSRTAGVAYGLVELKGRARVGDGETPLVGPLSGRPCVWFHYVVMERRGSGKNAKWVTIEDRRVDRRFWLEDAEGRIAVEPAGAEAVITCSKSSQRGDRRYTENWIEPGTELYALGSAMIDPSTGASLHLTRGPSSQPFLLSDLDEPELLLHKARRAFLLLNAGVAGGNAAALAMIGSVGALHGAGFLAAALAPLGFFTVFLAILMYNDLITLRQRIRLTWANIEVSLLKRADLVPRLESVLKAYLVHERGLQQDLAAMRSLAGQAEFTPAAAGALMLAEQSVMSGFRGLREAHPELASSQLGQTLSATLIKLENEIALMREGYNNAVERYNTRCQQVPEVAFAKAFRFQPGQSFHADIPMRAVPAIVLDTPPEAKAEAEPTTEAVTGTADP